MAYYTTRAQVGLHMQPEVASDICRIYPCWIELRLGDISIDQEPYENRFVGCSKILSSQFRPPQ